MLTRQITETANPEVDWHKLVIQIQTGDEAGPQKLHSVFKRGLRYLLLRNVGAVECESQMRAVFSIVLETIRAGELREPSLLRGLVRSVARVRIASHAERIQ
jgi:hypothetical protein